MQFEVMRDLLSPNHIVTCWERGELLGHIVIADRLLYLNSNAIEEAKETLLVQHSPKSTSLGVTSIG
ncbi:hypothetical protein LCGC14_2215740 [marine sediment metagenome]|uniref:Uncharacterized protein n=1 Tax=marine sediment metagenome TaxID=412755 RepID=A0A0F9G851_9ZZZZ